MASSFVPPSQLHAVVFVQTHRESRPLSSTPRTAPSRLSQPRSRARIPPTASSTKWSPASSTALNFDKPDHQSARYIDLRTMKVIFPEDAHISPVPPQPPGFSQLDNFLHLLTDSSNPSQLTPFLFSSDTVPLSDIQRNVVQALLSHRSALYSSATVSEKHAIFLDIAMRSRIWKESVVYCASTRRSAEAMYLTLSAQLGPDRQHEIFLHLDSYCPKDFYENNSVRIIITSPSILRNDIITGLTSTPVLSASMLFIDNVSDTSIFEWEDILLSLPSSILVCLLSSYLSRSELELLPIWIETIQNPVSVVNTPSSSTLLSRIERPQHQPLLRTFAYNGASHQAPVQLSLPILRDYVKKEMDSTTGDVIPNFAESFLHGVTLIPAEDPSKLLFQNIEQATYADVAALVVADAKRIEESMRAKIKRRSRQKKKDRTPSSRAAARRRRDNAYAESILLPAIVLINGTSETIAAAYAVRSALEGCSTLMWDEDTKEHIDDLVDDFISAHQGSLTEPDKKTLELLRSGIGVVHNLYTPAIRSLVEELFRASLIPLLVADTRLGSDELCALSSGKSVLIESGSMAVCDDTSKGLVLASTAASLAGRVGKDDVGNLIVMWYDDAVNDEDAGREIASTLLAPVLAGAWTETPQMSKPVKAIGKGFSPPHGPADSVELERGLQTKISCSYETILRSLRRFGVDGYELVYEYTLSSFKGWMERAGVHATLEKAIVENEAVKKRLEGEDWNSIADFGRKAAKVNEVRRMLAAMADRFESALERQFLLQLRNCRSGRIIGLKPHGLNDHTKSNLLEQNVDSSGTSDNGAEERSPEATLATANSDITKTLKSRNIMGNLTPAVFVALIDNSKGGKRPSHFENDNLVVCIMTDGLWTMVPLKDIQGISNEKDEEISNVDLLMIPHPATFDMDPESRWEKCVPVDESEHAAVQRISGDLIARLASGKKPRYAKARVAEFEAQRNVVEKAEEAHRSSPWYGREDEVKELRRLRRRVVELEDEMKLLERKKESFEEEMYDKRTDYQSIQTALMAVLEDCHALSFVGDSTMEMTPIGSLASILPCEYPLFSSACLCLIDGMEKLSIGEFTALITVITCPGRVWAARREEPKAELKDDDKDEIDFSSFQARLSEDNDDGYGAIKTDRGESSLDVERLHRLLPSGVGDMVIEIEQALHQLHRRHLGECQAVERVLVKGIVPPVLNLQAGQAVMRLVEGGAWKEVYGMFGGEGEYAVGELRRVRSVMEFMWKDEEYGEFSQKTRELAGRAFEALSVWPIVDEGDFGRLLESGVVERVWSGNTYDKWWRATKESAKGKVDEGKGGKQMGDMGKNEVVESVDAEVIDHA